MLQLHSFEAEHHHGPIADPDDKPYGNGALLWFESDTFGATIARAEEMEAEVVKPHHCNPPTGGGGPNHRRSWLRDPDGCIAVLASPDRSAE